jgi:hypothetical protein
MVASGPEAGRHVDGEATMPVGCLKTACRYSIGSQPAPAPAHRRPDRTVAAFGARRGRRVLTAADASLRSSWWILKEESMGTSKKDASLAGKQLADKKSTKAEKSVAASDLSQSRKPAAKKKR